MKEYKKEITNFLVKYSYTIYISFWLGKWNVLISTWDFWLFIIPFYLFEAIAISQFQREAVDKREKEIAKIIENIVNKHDNNLINLKSELLSFSEFLKKNN